MKKNFKKAIISTFFLIIFILAACNKTTKNKYENNTVTKNKEKQVNTIKENKKIVKNKNNKKIKSKLKKGCKNRMCNIPASDFIMGCNSKVDSNCEPDEKPAHKVYLNDFKIDQYEVTVAEFRKCVKAKACSSKNFEKYESEGEHYNYGYKGRDNHPMNAVTWYGAKEYCSFVNKRLPTEAEWEKAARGTDGRIYPWGNEKANCMYAVMTEDCDSEDCAIGDEEEEFEEEPNCGGDTSEVGTKSEGKSPYGLYDMAGNVWEWCSDFAEVNNYKKYILRGGGNGTMSANMRSSYRRFTEARSILDYYTTGFRCVKD